MISFSGAQGTGKTTLVRRVAQTYLDRGIKVLTIRDPVRRFSSICKLFYERSRDDIRSLFDMEYLVISQQYLFERLRRGKTDGLICYDGCVLDHLAYWKLLLKLHGSEQLLREEDEILQALFRHHVRDFDLIVYVHVDAELWSRRAIRDGQRSTDRTYYRLISSMFRRVISQENLKVAQIANDGKLEDTVAEVVNLVDALLAHELPGLSQPLASTSTVVVDEMEAQ